MRHLYIGLVVAVTTTLVPFWAMASNQEVAEEIAANLREGAQLHHYRIGIKFQDGTAWLKGHVANHEQMQKVLHVASATSGVDRVVNKITVKPSQPKKSMLTLSIPGGPMAPENLSATAVRNRSVMQQRFSGRASHPARRLQQVVDSQSTPVGQAQPVPSTYEAAPAQTVSAMIEQPQVSPQQMVPQMVPRQIVPQQRYVRSNQPIPVAYRHGGAPRMMPAPVQGAYQSQGQMQYYGRPMPMGGSAGVTPARYDQPHMPNYAWPSYAAYPNYAAVTYPRQYSPTAWPYIGPFYPYPQVPLGWRKVTLEWDDGWWMLDFKDTCH